MLVFVSVLVCFTLVAGECDDCNSLEEYCDKFENTCRSCDQLCTEHGRLQECADKCEHFMRNSIFSRHVGDQDMEQIQILLAVITAIVCLILILLVSMLICKIQKRNRKSPSKQQILPLNEFRSSTPTSVSSATRAPSHPTLNGSSSIHPPSTINYGRSMQTVTTQLSEESSSRYPVVGNGKRYQVSNGGYRSPTARMPSEDRVPEDKSYDNPSMLLSSPTKSAVTTPQRENTPYTISHSQVY